MRVPRTRNANTLTEAAYFGFIRSALRKAFQYNWKPVQQALDHASRPSQSANKRIKKEYQCNLCKAWFQRAEVEIDHIKECGSLRCYEDIPIFIQNLLPEDHKAYQIACKPCHKKKTKAYMDAKKF